MDIKDFRREYTLGGLSRKDLAISPFDQFDIWFKQALTTDIPDPSAMILATVANNIPSTRTVLLKSYDENGFIFYTNYKSQKAQEINSNPHVSLLFSWTALERQIEITGTVEKISRETSAAYFHSRPRSSQLGAWASTQSADIDSRATLDQQLSDITKKFGGENSPREIALPDFWGGYCVKPVKFEFWQGGKNRLHDRFEYRFNNSRWLISRLQP